MNLSEIQATSTVSARLDHRLLVRFSEADYEDLRGLAARSSMTCGSMVRHLIALGRRAKEGPDDAETRLLILAGLVAAEHAVLLLASFLPDGQRRMHESGALALDAASTRIDAVRDALGEGPSIGESLR